MMTTSILNDYINDFRDSINKSIWNMKDSTPKEEKNTSEEY